MRLVIIYRPFFCQNDVPDLSWPIYTRWKVIKSFSRYRKEAMNKFVDEIDYTLLNWCWFDDDEKAKWVKKYKKIERMQHDISERPTKSHNYFLYWNVRCFLGISYKSSFHSLIFHLCAILRRWGIVCGLSGGMWSRELTCMQN